MEALCGFIMIKYHFFHPIEGYCALIIILRLIKMKGELFQTIHLLLLDGMHDFIDPLLMTFFANMFLFFCLLITYEPQAHKAHQLDMVVIFHRLS